MNNDEYSDEIVNAIKDFLDDEGWDYSFVEEDGTFCFGVSMESRIEEIRYLIEVSNKYYVVYADSSIGVDEDDRDMMLKMAEFVCRVNDEITMGNFELDMDDGRIDYKTYVDCAGGMIPRREVVSNSIYICASMFNFYAPGILSIILENAEVEEALEQCEKESDQ